MGEGPVTVVALAERIHAHWRAAREAEGWRFGVTDANAKTSPFLKPLSAFTPREWRRERWLALTDLVAIAGARPRWDDIRIDTAPLRALSAPLSPSQHQHIAPRVHHAWSTINRHFGFADARAGARFEELDACAQARCRQNVDCDIQAIQGLIADHPHETLHIAPCADMHADAPLLAHALNFQR